MRMAWNMTGAALALLLGTASASAGTVTWPDGKRESLAKDQEITGPATVESEDGKDTIQIRPGALLKCLGVDVAEDGTRSECFLLKSGAARADLGYLTRLATPAYWAFSAARGKRAVLRAEVFPKDDGLRWCHARAEFGSGLVRLLLEPGDGVNRELALEDGQGVLVAREKSGGVRFTTDADNRNDKSQVRFTYPLAKGRYVDAYIGGGIDGAFRPGDHGDVLAACSLSSSRGSGIGLLTVADGKEVSRVSLAPGMCIWASPAGKLSAPGDAILAPQVEGLSLLPGPSAPPPGPTTLPDGGKVLSIRFEGGAEHPGRALVVLQNDGANIDSCYGELAFLRRTPAGHPEPFIPGFATFEIRDWKSKEERTISVDPPSGPSGDVLAVRLVPPGMASAPATSQGSLLFGGRVKVVCYESSLPGEKPWIRFTLENVEPGDSGLPLENLGYELTFRRGGKPIDAGPEFAKSKPVGQSIGKRGTRISLLVEGLPAGGLLVGTVPLLKLVR